MIHDDRRHVGRLQVADLERLNFGLAGGAKQAEQRRPGILVQHPALLGDLVVQEKNRRASVENDSVRSLAVDHDFDGDVLGREEFEGDGSRRSILLIRPNRRDEEQQADKRAEVAFHG